MRTGTQLAALLLLMACLTACEHAAQPEASIAHPAAALPASVTPPTRSPSTVVVDSRPMSAIAQDATDRADREQTLRVQKLLRDQARQLKRTSDAVQRGDANERCLDGQKMRHVANGWEQAGAC
jgi:hypothetical protein